MEFYKIFAIPFSSEFDPWIILQISKVYSGFRHKTKIVATYRYKTPKLFTKSNLSHVIVYI